MTTLLKADIFFFITSIAVVVVTLVMTIAGIYLIKLVQDVRTIVRKVDAEIDALKALRRDAAVKVRTFEKVLALIGTGRLFWRQRNKQQKEW